MATRPDSIELPSTLARAPEHAQRLFRATLASAIDEYGDGERARRTAYAAVKHQFERVGDTWRQKQTPGPSDHSDRDHPERAQGGVDALAPKSHLLDLARELGVRGRSRMTKSELVAAIRRENDRAADRGRDS